MEARKKRKRKNKKEEEKKEKSKRKKNRNEVSFENIGNRRRSRTSQLSQGSSPAGSFIFTRMQLELKALYNTNLALCLAGNISPMFKGNILRITIYFQISTERAANELLIYYEILIVGSCLQVDPIPHSINSLSSSSSPPPPPHHIQRKYSRCIVFGDRNYKHI